MDSKTKRKIQKKIKEFKEEQKKELDKLKDKEQKFYQSIIDEFIPNAKISGFKIRCSIRTSKNKTGITRYPTFYASKYSPKKKRGVNISLGLEFDMDFFEKKISNYLLENSDLF